MIKFVLSVDLRPASDIFQWTALSNDVIRSWNDAYTHRQRKTNNDREKVATRASDALYVISSDVSSLQRNRVSNDDDKSLSISEANKSKFSSDLLFNSFCRQHSTAARNNFIGTQYTSAAADRGHDIG